MNSYLYQSMDSPRKQNFSHPSWASQKPENALRTPLAVERNNLYHSTRKLIWCIVHGWMKTMFLGIILFDHLASTLLVLAASDERDLATCLFNFACVVIMVLSCSLRQVLWRLHGKCISTQLLLWPWGLVRPRICSSKMLYKNSTENGKSLLSHSFTFLLSKKIKICALTTIMVFLCQKKSKALQFGFFKTFPMLVGFPSQDNRWLNFFSSLRGAHEL